MRTDLTTPAKILQRATKKVQERWLCAKQEWDDPVSDRFQEKYLEPIVPQVQLVLTAMHEMRAVLDKAVEETRDDGV